MGNTSSSSSHRGISRFHHRSLLFLIIFCRFRRHRHHFKIDAEESTYQMFEVTVPEGVGMGDHFALRAGGVSVVVPATAPPGQPMRFVVLNRYLPQEEQ